MLTLYKAALGPALLLQGSRLRKTALRLPEAAGARHGLIKADDPEPLRLLFVGDSSAAGVGVEWQHEALAHQTAALVAAASARTVEWTLIAQSGATTRDAIELVKAQATERADVVISALGVNDVTSQASARRFISDYKALLGLVADRTGARAAVLSGLPPLHILPAAPQPLRWYLGQCAKRLDAALHELSADHLHLRFVSLAWAKASEMARDKFHPGKGQYRQWAHLVAEQVLSVARSQRLLDASPHPTAHSGGSSNGRPEGQGMDATALARRGGLESKG
jgi:lysophospholipase L1-like esterase